MGSLPILNSVIFRIMDWWSVNALLFASESLEDDALRLGE
jgi:hypothetical protein